jgi:hypothetical protein
VVGRLGKVEVAFLFPNYDGSCSWMFKLDAVAGMGPNREARSLDAAKAAAEAMFEEMTGVTLARRTVVEAKPRARRKAVKG